MFLGVYRFTGEPAALLQAYERLLLSIPAQNLHLHICTEDAQGLEVFDACPTREVFESFAASAQFSQALRSAGLPTPAVRSIGVTRAAFVHGERID